MNTVASWRMLKWEHSIRLRISKTLLPDPLVPKVLRMILRKD